MTRKSGSGAGTDFIITAVTRQYIALIPETVHCIDSWGSLLPWPSQPWSVVSGPRGGNPRVNLAVHADRGWALHKLTPVTLLLLPLGTEAGPPGPRGLPAAPRVGSASRCGSGPAATPPRGTGAGCAWGRTARRGGYLPSAPPGRHPPASCHPGAVGFPAVSVSRSSSACLWHPFLLSRMTSFLSSFNFDQSLGWTASLVGVEPAGFTQPSGS